MSSSGRENSSCDALDTDFNNLQLLENKRIAREKSMNHKKLFIAISDRNVEEVCSLLKVVDINFKDQDGYSALHCAVETGDIRIIELLISHGADLHSKNNGHETPVDLAEQMNRSDIVNILKASINTPNKLNVTTAIKKTSESKRKLSSQNQEIWINPVHGYIYQLKVLMLFLHRGLSCKYSFRLGTEIKEAKKFDDLVFEYVNENKKVYRLLQAKHKFDESKKITVDKLLTETKGDYSLAKYFYSFQACKKDNFFKDGIIKDVIICTNIDFDWDDLKNFGIEMKKVKEEDEILDIKSDQKVPARYKFTNSMVSKLKSKLKPGESDKEIECFLNHLMLAVNQPNEEELGQIVKKEIGKEIGFLDTENAYNKLLVKMMDLSLGKSSNMFLSHEEGKKFFDDLKTEIPVWFNVQDPVISFTGRSNYLKQMHKTLKKSFTCISGMGGLGKTELVRKYIANYGHEYNNQIVWINAESHRTAADSFRQLASDKLNISLISPDGKEKHITSIITEVYQFFSKGKSLFIFDNAEKYKSLNESDCGIDQFFPCLPDTCTKPNIIITSRNQKWPESIKIIVLKAFTEDEAKELVEKVLTFKSDEDEKLIAELCKKMQFLPLALQQAVAYIKVQKEKLACMETSFDISNYLERYSDMTQELLDFKFSEDNNSNYDKSVFATWNITFDTLKQKENGQDAIDVLNLISYFLPDNISIDLLLIFSTDKEKLSSAIGLLKQYSIVSVQHKALSVHRLVQQVTRMKLQGQQKEFKILETALKPLLAGKGIINYKNVDHVISMWKFARSHCELFEESLIVADYIITTLLEHGGHEEAISLGSEVSKLFTLHSPNALSREIDYLPIYLSIRSHVALCITIKGDYNRALEEFQEIYKTQTTTLGLKPSSKNVLYTLHNIAQGLEYLGRFKEALQCYFEQLDGLKANYDESHPWMLLVKSKITIHLCDQGRQQEALAIFQDVYDAYKRIGSDRNEETLVIENNIAIAHAKLNRTEEAFKILERVHKKGEAILPKNNVNNSVNKFHLAAALVNQGNYSAALEMYQELFDTQKTNFGEDHPEAIQLSARIAIVLKFQGEFEKALEILKNALKKQQNILGVEHPQTLNTQYEVANVLLKQKKYKDANKLYEDLLEKQSRVLGISHVDTFHTRRSIVEVLGECKKFDAALELSLKVFEDSKKIFGENHEITLTDKVNVGGLYCKSSHTHSKGLAILREALIAQEKFLGKDHPLFQETRKNIALWQIEVKPGQTHDFIAQCKKAFSEGVDINGQDENGSTVLHEALKIINEPLINFLLQEGAEIFVTNNDGETPLHIAVIKGQEKFVTMLLQKIKPTRLNDFVDAATISTGSTALHVAAQKGYFSIVKCLLKSRATFCAKNKEGKTPLDVAKSPKITKFLKMARELFEGLKQDDAIKIVKKLKGLSTEEFLAAANMRNDQGSTLTQVAILNKHKQVAADILKMLQSKSK